MRHEERTYQLRFTVRHGRRQIVVRDEQAGSVRRFEGFSGFAQHLKALARACAEDIRARPQGPESK